MNGKQSNSTSLARRSADRRYGLSSKQFADLRALGEDSEIGYRVLLDGIYSESVRYLDALARDVHEGKNVLPAADFARWLQFSGVLQLLSRYALPDQNFPPLDRKLSDLLQDCGEHLRGGRVSPTYSVSDIAEINRKLDVLLASSARPATETDVVISLRSRTPQQSNPQAVFPQPVDLHALPGRG